MEPTTIRPMAIADARAVAVLAQQAGYRTTGDEIARRHAAVMSLPHSMLYVAHAADDIIGWAHVHGIFDLLSDSYAAVLGLGVRADLRGRGVGRALIDECRRWAHANGFPDLRLP
ncbi:GNAT family N-acetyltransferase [Piscinibacter sp. XHJ-5]|uniref:GNAT family N-acetyltransferase n=1 Tax=Piscinibacter sp. XHJ-5 TaxID=3037797 RepID=UPI002452E813|nr:GNAT family N-acetyltransferase [Piscinibacter sp. XHJ-5]